MNTKRNRFGLDWIEWGVADSTIGYRFTISSKNLMWPVKPCLHIEDPYTLVFGLDKKLFDFFIIGSKVPFPKLSASHLLEFFVLKNAWPLPSRSPLLSDFPCKVQIEGSHSVQLLEFEFELPDVPTAKVRHRHWCGTLSYSHVVESIWVGLGSIDHGWPELNESSADSTVGYKFLWRIRGETQLPCTLVMGLR